MNLTKINLLSLTANDVETLSSVTEGSGNLIHKEEYRNYEVFYFFVVSTLGYKHDPIVNFGFYSPDMGEVINKIEAPYKTLKEAKQVFENWVDEELEDSLRS
jgi:hypothetical protein